MGTLFRPDLAAGPLPTVVAGGGWCYVKEIVLPHVARIVNEQQVMPEHESFDAPYADLAHNRFIVGAPDDCLAALLPLRDELGVNHLIIRTHWAGMPVQDSVSSIELLAREVVPTLRSGA